MNEAIEPIRPLQLSQSQTAVQAAAPSLRYMRIADEPMRDVDIEFNWTKFCIACFVPVLCVYAIIVAYYTFTIVKRVLPERRESIAIKQMTPLNLACKTYFIRNQQWPANLQQLLVADAHKCVYLDLPEMLIDTWGQPFQYDPAGPKNKGTQPDIWTVAPDGTVIGNWSDLNRRPQR
jgi:hypothetical protein